MLDSVVGDGMSGAARAAVSHFHEGFIAGLTDWMLSGPVDAALDKEAAVNQELTRALQNYDASLFMNERARDAIDRYDTATPNACQTAITGSESITAAAASDNTAKSMTAMKTRIATDVFNSSAEAGQALRNHREHYCSQESEARGRCTRAHSGELQDADVDAKTILGAVSGDTMDYEQYVAANRYIDMATNPVPDEVLPPALERTPAGQRYLIEQRVAAAQASAARYSLSKIVAQRRPKNEQGQETAAN